MKYIITLVLITLLFSVQILSQENNRTIPSPYKGLIDKLSEIHNLKIDDSKDLNKKKIYPAALRNNKLIQVLKNLENKFYKTEELNNENSRTITSETLLADGFLLTESVSQNWDGPTSSWVNNSRSIFLYDPRNNRVQETYQNWNAGAWENNSRYSYTYDTNDNQTGYTYQTWNGTTWVNNSRSLLTYDVNNNNTQYTYQTWSGTAWTNIDNYLYIYDSNNNPTQYLYQTWNGTIWVDNSRTNYLYDANNNQIEYTYQTWSGTAWVNYSKSTSTYDVNNNLVQEIYQTWDGSTWVNESRSTYNYDANNNQILYLYQTWDVSVWKNNNQYTAAYNANNHPIEYIFQSWDVTVWKNESKYSYIYDANENIIEFLYQSWDVSVWKNEFKYSYMYDSNNNRIEFLYQTWNVSVWENSSRSTTTYDSNNNYTEEISQSWDVPTSLWVNQYKYLYTWASETSIVLTSPNGGENWPVGTVKNITWTSSNIANIKLQYSTNNGTNWINITNVSASAGSYSWTIANTISTNCKVLISDVSITSVFDESDSIFTISPPPAVTVTAPNGGESWDVGSSNSITWTSISIDNVKIDYSTNNGTNWINIVASTAASAGSYSWTIPNTASTNCKVRISDVTNAAIVDQSDNVFTILIPATPTINVTSPNGGESWDVGSTYAITWTSNLVSDIKIEYSTNNGTSWANIISSTPSDGTYNWIIPNAPSTNCRIRISDVTNSTYTDQSDNVFTINVPIAPGITVTSPNGGEKWPAGSTHSITWVSSNVTNVRIDYTTTGTDLINIITSTAASAGSYSWTLPDTIASTNCKVIISDVSAPTTTFDLSDNVFTIFTYPSAITLSTTYSFGDATKTSSYQIIGLPGANNLPITSIVTGTPGANGDWRAFWDSGTGAYTEYSSGSTFNFTPGKAFWVVSKNQISVNQNVNAVTLATDNSYSIPLHNEWNLISNPFNKSITWNSVQNVNTGVTETIHFYQAGSYTNSANFDQYKGYYFFNNPALSMSSLKIPYSTTTPLPKNPIVLNELEIVLKADAIQKAFISVGVSKDAKPGVDMLDLFSPPSEFCNINMSLYNNELETNYKYLQKDYRSEIGEGQEFNFSIKNLSDQTLDIVANGMDNFTDFEIFLLDKSLSKLYDLTKQKSFEVKANTMEKQYSILIGTEAFILQKKQELMPTEFALFQNYPNPFNPSTRIMFSLPLQSDVSLKIYNVLGELTADLINNQVFEAGYHEINFDGSKLASGVYLYKFQTTSSSGRQPFIEVKKMILVK